MSSIHIIGDNVIHRLAKTWLFLSSLFSCRNTAKIAKGCNSCHGLQHAATRRRAAWGSQGQQQNAKKPARSRLVERWPTCSVLRVVHASVVGLEGSSSRRRLPLPAQHRRLRTNFLIERAHQIGGVRAQYAIWPRLQHGRLFVWCWLGCRLGLGCRLWLG